MAKGHAFAAGWNKSPRHQPPRPPNRMAARRASTPPSKGIIMLENCEEIDRAIDEAKRRVAEDYQDAPSKQDLISTYQLTDDEIDDLERRLKERLGRLGRIAVGIEGVYYEHLDQALRGRKGQPKPESLLEDVRDRIEQGPARQLANELARQGANEFKDLVEAMLDCVEACTEEPAGTIGPFEPRRCDVAGELAPTSSPVFANIPAPENDLERVGAARKLAHVVALGEDMRVFDAAATLRNRWAEGQYEFCSVNLRNNLYCDLRSCDCGMLPEAERQALYAAVFGFTGDDLPAGTRVNRGFSAMWERFNDTVLRFLMSDEGTEATADTKKEGIFAATIDLQSNLADNMTEANTMRITDLHKQVLRELELFNDPAVFGTVAPGCKAGWWEVVERLTGPPEDGRSLIASFELASRRDAIFEWVASFRFPGTPTGTVFDNMVNAVSALSGTAPWMPAIVAQDRPAIAGRSDQLRPAYPQLGTARTG
jgi:hypothetical protein